ncbi:acyl-CoA dehydrogenase [Candidatus Bathyarchaeota archaeon CG07_land_8_20_14_0_80_47_9]|nr:MAG: acyl-CoA dehydrogenase [Candidatus Bathyarchaeota archaeon CG07_land_8_20_14_0_80_47_9]
MEPFSWWNEKQKGLMEDVKAFADQNLPRGEEIFWTKEFPIDLLKEVARKGWFGAVIPENYGGINAGVTGASIVSEELSRVCSALGDAYEVSMFGGVEQFLTFGTDEQKQKWLPKIAKGEVVGAVCITEPFVGSDAAGIETTAKREGDHYVLNGKKRFITNAGLADIYVVYARTSEKPEDKAKYQHLTAFLVEKGVPGFSVEKINELSGWIGLPNGFLDFNDVKVLTKNLIGPEGAGWKVMMAGLNFERVVFSAGMLGPMRESIRHAVAYAQRRMQFDKPTIDIPSNQSKIAEMFAGLYTARLLIYHAAYLLDQHKDAMVEAATAKMFTSDTYEKLVSDAVQVMGGDGWTRFYPVESYLRDAKVNQIGAGTNQIMRLVIFRGGLKALGKDLKMPRRRIHEKLKVPISTVQPPSKTNLNEESVLKLLSEDYMVNPGLFMSREDLKERLADASEEKLDQALKTLESEGSVKLYRDGRGTIALVKATYDGLRKAGPLEKYKWYPEWLSKEFIF